MIDRVAEHLGRRLFEVPVGFKWFVAGFMDGSLGFGGEESSGATMLRRDGSVWTTDKDGLVPNLLAAEITARTGRDPGEHYRRLTAEFGDPVYERIDAPATPEQKARVEKLKSMETSKIAPLAVYLASDASADVSGQIFGVRANEIFLFSQNRPLRSVHRAGGWTAQAIAEQAIPAMRAQFYPLERSQDVFSWDPI